MGRHCRFRFTWIALALTMLISACGGSGGPPPLAIPNTPAAVTGAGAGETVELGTPAYRLGSGDEVRVSVFRHEDLSGEFALDGEGKLAMPLIGEVAAYGLTSRELEDRIEEMLRDGYLVDPQVSIEVLSYRPFYILGEVNQPGSYEYDSGMTVLNAVALAGGFTYRAQQNYFLLQRGSAQAEPVRVPGTQEILPGDIVTVDERFF